MLFEQSSFDAVPSTSSATVSLRDIYISRTLRRLRVRSEALVLADVIPAVT
jgi:hypothetical protein